MRVQIYYTYRRIFLISYGIVFVFVSFKRVLFYYCCIVFTTVRARQSDVPAVVRDSCLYGCM